MTRKRVFRDLPTGLEAVREQPWAAQPSHCPEEAKKEAYINRKTHPGQNHTLCSWNKLVFDDRRVMGV